MSELPQGWATAHLEELTENPKQDIVDGPFGSNLKASEYVDVGIPIVRLQNIDRNRFLEKNIRCVTSLKADELSRHSFLSGDVIITKLGAPVGKACIVPTTLPRGVIVADVVRARVNERKALKEFVSYAINSPEVVSQINLEVKGSTRPRVNLGHIRALELPLPPLNEQRRIVAKLEELLGRVDASQQRLENIPVIIKRFRQSVLAAACSGRLTADWREEQAPLTRPAATLSRGERGNAPSPGASRHRLPKGEGKILPPLPEGEGRGEGEELPEGWEYSTISEHCLDSFYGPRFAKEEYAQVGIPTIRTTDFTEKGRIVLNNPPCIEIPQDKKAKFLLNKEDLLVTRTGSIGKMAIFREDYEALPSAYLIRFRFTKGISVDYVFHYLMSSKGQELLGLGATSVTQPNINAETIKALPIPLPPLPEQNEIVRRVEALFTLADQLEARYRTAKAHVDKLTQSILAKAFRGELVPQDPNDEPASVLLERIRAERPSPLPLSRRERGSRNNPRPPGEGGAKRRVRGVYAGGEEPLPLAAEPIVAYKAPTVGQAAFSSKNQPVPQRILAAMQPGRDYSRAEIISASDISDTEWTWAIRQLKEEGKVRQTGERRGARYNRKQE